MATKMFVNLPVSNLKKSIDFFTKLGFTFNPQFTDETATCMIVGEDNFVMLLTREKFKTFTPKDICDATKSTEVLVVCRPKAERPSTRQSERRSPAAVQRTIDRKTTGSCTNMDFRIWMGIFGN